MRCGICSFSRSSLTRSLTFFKLSAGSDFCLASAAPDKNINTSGRKTQTIERGDLESFRATFPGQSEYVAAFKCMSNSSILLSNGACVYTTMPPIFKNFREAKGVQAGIVWKFSSVLAVPGTWLLCTAIFLSEPKTLILKGHEVRRCHLAQSMREAMCFVNKI